MGHGRPKGNSAVQDSATGVTPLALALLTLGRTRTGGLLGLASGADTIQLSIQRGRLVELIIPAKGLVLAQRSTWERRFAEWTIERSMLTTSLALSFAPSLAGKGSALGDGPCTASLAIKLVRRVLRHERLSWRRCRGHLQLQRGGRFLLECGALFPHETAMLRLLERHPQASGEDCVACGGGGARAVRSLAALRLVGAVSLVPGPYALLLKKHRQLRDGEGAATLLGLSGPASPQEVSRAYRQLASKLHPDRLGPVAPATAREVSERVFHGLWRAQDAMCKELQNGTETVPQR